MKNYYNTYRLNKTLNGLSIAFLTITMLFSHDVSAQPYLDIMNVKCSNSPSASLFNQNKNNLQLNYFTANTNIPVQFKNKKDAVVFSPFFEKWEPGINNKPHENYYSIGLPFTISKTIPHTRWNFLITGITRMNDSSIDKNAKLQVGGACIIGHKKNGKITYRLGLYINNELFGVFVVPLVGIDWKISKKDNLFGVLPGNLTYEHKLNKHFYYGACFRSITNSYARTKGYWRIDENQLGLYLDSYFNKNIVFNIEAGHSMLRKIRTGIRHISTNDSKVNDELYFKASFAYRIRF